MGLLGAPWDCSYPPSERRTEDPFRPRGGLPVHVLEWIGAVHRTAWSTQFTGCTPYLPQHKSGHSRRLLQKAICSPLPRAH